MYSEKSPNEIDRGDFWIISPEPGSWNLELILEALPPLPAPLGWGISDSGRTAEIRVRPLDDDLDFEEVVRSPVLATYRWRNDRSR